MPWADKSEKLHVLRPLKSYEARHVLGPTSDFKPSNPTARSHSDDENRPSTRGGFSNSGAVWGRLLAGEYEPPGDLWLTLASYRARHSLLDIICDSSSVEEDHKD